MEEHQSWPLFVYSHAHDLAVEKHFHCLYSDAEESCARSRARWRKFRGAAPMGQAESVWQVQPRGKVLSICGDILGLDGNATACHQQRVPRRTHEFASVDERKGRPSGRLYMNTPRNRRHSDNRIADQASNSISRYPGGSDSEGLSIVAVRRMAMATLPPTAKVVAVLVLGTFRTWSEYSFRALTP